MSFWIPNSLRFFNLDLFLVRDQGWQLQAVIIGFLLREAPDPIRPHTAFLEALLSWLLAQSASRDLFTAIPDSTAVLAAHATRLTRPNSWF